MLEREQREATERKRVLWREEKGHIVHQIWKVNLRNFELYHQNSKSEFKKFLIQVSIWINLDLDHIIVIKKSIIT